MPVPARMARKTGAALDKTSLSEGMTVQLLTCPFHTKPRTASEVRLWSLFGHSQKRRKDLPTTGGTALPRIAYWLMLTKLHGRCYRTPPNGEPVEQALHGIVLEKLVEWSSYLPCPIQKTVVHGLREVADLTRAQSVASR
jgi:hypothetical protein